jgi:hypothetical protein
MMERYGKFENDVTNQRINEPTNEPISIAPRFCCRSVRPVNQPGAVDAMISQFFTRTPMGSYGFELKVGYLKIWVLIISPSKLS